jgi:shikimate kinase
MTGEPGAGATGASGAPVAVPDDRHLVLVGLMGVGKSTVGAVLAGRLGRPFVDLDDVVCAAEGMPVNRIMGERGEDAFRSAESAALAAVLDGDPVVLATGGGAVLDPDNRALLAGPTAGRPAPLVVWLSAPVATLVDRVAPGGATRRPLLADGGAEVVLGRLAGERHALYGDVATVVVEAGEGTPREVADRVIEAVAGAVPVR